MDSLDPFDPLDTLVVIPTYNESDNLPELVSQILALPVPVGILVVDDNSPDGTGELAERFSHEHPGRVAVVHRAEKQGLGTAYLAGFCNAMELGARRVMTMDADFSHHPRYIPDLIALSQEKDLVIGSRYVRGGGTLNCKPSRLALSWVANVAARAALGLHARDTTAGFRLYRREVLETIPLDSIFSSGYSFLVEMLYLVQEGGWRVGETPIVFEDRRAGASKISRWEVGKAMYTVARLGARRLHRAGRSALGLPQPAPGGEGRRQVG